MVVCSLLKHFVSPPWLKWSKRVLHIFLVQMMVFMHRIWTSELTFLLVMWWGNMFYFLILTMKVNLWTSVNCFFKAKLLKTWWCPWWVWTHLFGCNFLIFCLINLYIFYFWVSSDILFQVYQLVGDKPIIRVFFDNFEFNVSDDNQYVAVVNVQIICFDETFLYFRHFS